MDQTTDRKLIVGRRVDQKREAINLDFTGHWRTEDDDRRFREVLDKTLVENEGKAGRYLVFDLTHVPVIYGAGLEEMINYHGVCAKRRGLMILINPSERVRHDLEQRFHESLTEFFDIEETAEKANERIDGHRQMTADATTVQADGP